MRCSNSFAIGACACLSLVGGGTYAFATNVILNTPCNPRCSEDTSFRKPWFVAFVVVFVQAVANMLALGMREASQSDGPPEDPSQASQAQAMSVFEPTMRLSLVTISLLDASTVFLQSVASLFIPAAVNGAMRGALLLITAWMSRVLRVSDGQAGKAEWVGIMVSTFGALAVGAVHVAGAAFPAVAAGDHGSKPTANAALQLATAADAVIGIFLSLLSNVTLALGIAWETKVFEKRKPNAISFNIFRTTIGAVVMVVAMAIASYSPPPRDHGYMENGAHTACCISNTPALAGFAMVVGICASISGISGLYLSILAGSNFRAIIYVARALWMWVLELVTYYGGDGLGDSLATVYGRPWNVFSYPMAFGFALVLLGGGMTWKGRLTRMVELEPLAPHAVGSGHVYADEEGIELQHSAVAEDVAVPGSVSSGLSVSALSLPSHSSGSVGGLGGAAAMPTVSSRGPIMSRTDSSTRVNIAGKLE